MWMDELDRKYGGAFARSGRVSIGGASPAAEADTELRELKILRCGGVLRMPAADEEQLILCCDDGERALLGSLDGEIPNGLQPGEIFIATENGALIIKNSGKFLLTGELEICGSLSVNGRYVDGAET
ncbi:MAG: hypothetical protein HUJ66_07315 [Oscillospiraceae bacterium]|nr:hypothetical protein [Oscillospiraceae bacterium]